jgi:hypothetical protein
MPTCYRATKMKVCELVTWLRKSTYCHRPTCQPNAASQMSIMSSHVVNSNSQRLRVSAASDNTNKYKVLPLSGLPDTVVRAEGLRRFEVVN